VVTDPAEVARLAQENEADNVVFRRWLHAHHDDGRLLHHIAAGYTAEIDCTLCAACCRETKVDVCSDEIARLGAHLKLRPAEVERLYTEADGTGRILLQPTGECVFLDHGWCLVYEARPDACRHFPYIKEEAASLGARLESLCRKAHFCPIVYNTIEELKHRLGYHARF